MDQMRLGNRRRGFMDEWRAIRSGTGTPGAPLKRLVTMFYIYDSRIPGGTYKIRIYESALGSFLGGLNVAARDRYGFPDYTGGSGETVFEALNNTIKHFFESVPSDIYNDPTKFVWETDAEY